LGEDQIDIVVYSEVPKEWLCQNPLRDKLYNLTYEEVRIIDQEIEEIISKEEYEKFEMQ